MGPVERGVRPHSAQDAKRQAPNALLQVIRIAVEPFRIGSLSVWFHPIRFPQERL